MKLRDIVCPVEGMPCHQFLLRCFWIAAQVSLAYCLAGQASPFFYQQF